MREWIGLTDLCAGIKSKIYISDGCNIYVSKYGERKFKPVGAMADSFSNNCNYCDQQLRLDKNNRCICCGAQK